VWQAFVDLDRLFAQIDRWKSKSGVVGSHRARAKITFLGDGINCTNVYERIIRWT
jgi:hypothetical protein